MCEALCHVIDRHSSRIKQGLVNERSLAIRVGVRVMARARARGRGRGRARARATMSASKRYLDQDEGWGCAQGWTHA